MNHKGGNLLKNKYYSKIQSVLCANGFYNHDVCYVLKSKDLDANLLAVACSRFQPDEYLMIEIDCRKRSTVRYIESAYLNTDFCLFKWIELGYDIKYMGIDYHAQVWNDIVERQEEMDWSEGTSVYTDFCRSRGITKKLLDEYVEDTDDIMNLQEK